MGKAVPKVIESLSKTEAMRYRNGGYHSSSLEPYLLKPLGNGCVPLIEAQAVSRNTMLPRVKGGKKGGVGRLGDGGGGVESFEDKTVHSPSTGERHTGWVVVAPGKAVVPQSIKGNQHNPASLLVPSRTGANTSRENAGQENDEWVMPVGRCGIVQHDLSAPETLNQGLLSNGYSHGRL